MGKLPIDTLSLSVWLLSWFYEADENIYLAIDRTQWQWGIIQKSASNFLLRTFSDPAVMR